MARRSSNQALQRRPCNAVLTLSFNAVRGPAERGRWATTNEPQTIGRM